MAAGVASILTGPWPDMLLLILSMRPPVNLFGSRRQRNVVNLVHHLLSINSHIDFTLSSSNISSSTRSSSNGVEIEEEEEEEEAEATTKRPLLIIVTKNSSNSNSNSNSNSSS